MAAKIFPGLVAFLLSFLAVYSHAFAAPAAPVKITNVAVKRAPVGVYVDLNFDRPVSAKSLKPGFERNFVQLVLRSTKIDAARILPVADSEVQKIFAYPYNSDTARLRIILKGDNAWAKGRVSLWNNNAKSVRIFVKEAQGATVAETPEVAAQPVANNEETKLLKEVMSNTREIDIHNPDSVKAALAASKPAPIGREESEKTETASTEPVGIKANPTSHFTRMALVLFGILGVFLGGVLLVRRYAVNLKKLPFGKKERLIQVVATHYMGAKKSICLVKVAGEYMVVGTSNEGIHLISKLGPEVSVEKYLEDRFWGGTFEKHLDKYARDPKVNKEIDFADGLATKTAGYDGPRDLIENRREPAAPVVATEELGDGPAVTVASQIADKVELSPLRASIKEKLTKLKPLQ